MGYRIRLGKVAKSEKEKYSGMTYKEVEATMPECSALYRPPFHTELYEIGKYVDYSDGVEDFYDFDIQELTESEFGIMSKDCLKKCIETYHKEISDYYIKLEKEPERHPGYFNRKVRQWYPEKHLSITPYYLDEPSDKTDGEIVRSWLMEYAIFNLVYIYRTFDWENDYLIYSGW